MSQNSDDSFGVDLLNESVVEDNALVFEESEEIPACYIVSTRITIEDGGNLRVRVAAAFGTVDSEEIREREVHLHNTNKLIIRA